MKYICTILVLVGIISCQSPSISENTDASPVSSSGPIIDSAAIKVDSAASAQIQQEGESRKGNSNSTSGNSHGGPTLDDIVIPGSKKGIARPGILEVVDEYEEMDDDLKTVYVVVVRNLSKKTIVNIGTGWNTGRGDYKEASHIVNHKVRIKPGGTGKLKRPGGTPLGNNFTEVIRFSDGSYKR